jgi:predicted deacylase
MIFTGFQPTWASENLVYLNSYEENKTEFLKLAGSNTLSSWELPTDSRLTTDLALLKYGKTPSDEVIVISSGLHGIEGYVGSSIQRDLMKNFKFKSDVLMVHALNPWGMKNKRRVDENNIDLNRNFIEGSEAFKIANPDYLKINSFLNPTEFVSINFFQRFGFFARSIQLILQFGIEPLRKSILVGQYTESKGLYYGGSAVSYLKNKVDHLLKTTLAPYKKILWIDLHTGYGENRKLHLLANDENSTEGQRLKARFKDQKIDFGNQKSFYKTTGDLAGYLNSKSTDSQEITALVFEYGTLDSQKTLGSIESLRRMVLENQGFQYGYTNEDSKLKTRELFQDQFFPQDSDWKKSIKDQTDLLFKSIKI